jgi:hypothetical protein
MNALNMLQKIFCNSAANQKVNVLVFALWICLCTSCSNSGNGVSQQDSGRLPGDSSDAKAKEIDTAAAAAMISNKLYTLYLENTGTNPQLYRLLGDKPNQQKIVLQFFRTSTGILGLYAYPSKQNNKDFVVAAKTALSISDNVDVNLYGKEVVLGDLQSTKKDVDSLQKYMVANGAPNKPGFEYIWFVPEVRKEDLSGLNYVFYNIRASSATPKAAMILKDLGEANPSPPRTIY